jgi:ABC-type uncharacterized transport system permease subunit
MHNSRGNSQAKPLMLATPVTGVAFAALAVSMFARQNTITCGLSRLYFAATES